MYIRYERITLAAVRSRFHGQKVNKKIDTYGHSADDSGTDLCPWPWDDAASRQNISTPFSIRNEFEATEYSYFIRYSYSKFPGYLIQFQ